MEQAARTPSARAWALAGLCLASAALPLPADFLRGDADGDGRVRFGDAIAGLQAFFAGHALGCRDAADADDDGQLGAADAIAILRALFLGEALPAPGANHAGPDPSCDALDCASATEAADAPAVVLNEVHYHPLRPLDEFVELFNRSRTSVDLGGWRLAGAVGWGFAAGTVLEPGQFLLVLRDPSSPVWRRNPSAKVGPWEGALSNRADRVALLDAADCRVEALDYGDGPPWPIGPDGYGPSLERVDPAAPCSDSHSWRTARVAGGTPGAANSTLGTPRFPRIVGASFEPAQPRSGEPLKLTVTLDGRWQDIASVEVLSERLRDNLSPPERGPLALLRAERERSVWSGMLASGESPAMLRATLELRLGSGAILPLPHPADPAPILSAFVYDGETASRLPVLWLFPPLPSGIVEGHPAISGAAIQEPEPRAVLAFDGARLRISRNGLKLEFLKGAEHRGDRTINITPEEGQAIAALGAAPHVEHLAFEIFREIGAAASWARWFRVIDFRSRTRRHSQRLVFQQPNRPFLAMQGLDPDGDLYKLTQGSFIKQTNIETGNASLQAFLSELQSPQAARRRAAALERCDLESFELYSVACALIANGDGLRNNLFLYHDLSLQGRWRIFPWDLDQTFLAPDFALESFAGGTLSAAYHEQPDLDRAFRLRLRAQIQPGGIFHPDTLLPRIAELEATLLEDLALQEAQIGAERAGRRQQIRSAYELIRRYVQARYERLRQELP